MAAVKAPDIDFLDTPTSLRMTEEAYERWIDEDVKSEWVDGEVIIMPPSSTKHVQLAGFLLQVMGLFVKHHELGELFGPELQIRFAKMRRRRVPDLLFVSKARLEIIQPNYVEGPPDLVVEIVSPDSLARDWREKYLEYEAAGVKEYWVVDPMAERVEAYALDEAQKYQRLEEEKGVIHSTVLPDFFLETAWLWPEPLPNPLDILKTLAVLS